MTVSKNFTKKEWYQWYQTMELDFNFGGNLSILSSVSDSDPIKLSSLVFSSSGLKLRYQTPKNVYNVSERSNNSVTVFIKFRGP